MNRLFLRPLPGIENADRIVELGRTSREGRGFDSFSYPDFLSLREVASPLAEVAGWDIAMMSRSVEEGGERVSVMHASANSETRWWPWRRVPPTYTGGQR